MAKIPEYWLGKVLGDFSKGGFKGPRKIKLPEYWSGQVLGDVSKGGFKVPRKTKLPKYWPGQVLGDVSRWVQRPVENKASRALARASTWRCFQRWGVWNFCAASAWLGFVRVRGMCF